MVIGAGLAGLAAALEARARRRGGRGARGARAGRWPDVVAGAAERSGDRDGGGVRPRRQQRRARAPGARPRALGQGDALRRPRAARRDRDHGGRAGRGRARGRPGGRGPRWPPIGARAARLARDRARRSRGDPRPRRDLVRLVRRRHPGHRPRRLGAHRHRAGAERRGGNQGLALGLAERLGEAVRLGDAAALVEWGAAGSGSRPRPATRTRRRRRRRRAGRRDRPDPVRARAARRKARRLRPGALRARGEAVRPAARAGTGRRGDERPRALLVLDRDRARRGDDAGRQRFSGSPARSSASASPTVPAPGSTRRRPATGPRPGPGRCGPRELGRGSLGRRRVLDLAGSRSRGALAEPVGPLAFAGEHIGGRFNGLMEGAIRSGRAAAAALDDLDV